MSLLLSEGGKLECHQQTYGKNKEKERNKEKRRIGETRCQMYKISGSLRASNN